MVRAAYPVDRIACAIGATRRAFTLIEVLIAMIVLAMAVVAVTQAVTAGHAQTQDALHRARAVALAEVMIEEIVSKSYGDPQPGALGAPTGLERSDYTEIAHFHGHEEEPGEVRDQAGEAYPEAYQPFTRTVTVALESQQVSVLGERDGLLVRVTVSDERDTSWTISRFIAEAN